MSTVVLIQAQPRFASNGAVADIRLAGGGTKAYFQLGFGDWRSGVARPPRFSTAIGFDQRGLTGGALPSTGAFEFGSSDKALFSALGNVIWDGARVIVSTGDDEVLAPVYAPQLVGTVAAIRTDGAKITFTIADLSIDLDKPVIPDTFAGTGDLEGGDEATGRPKRRSWGRVFNVEGRVLDKAQNVYEFGDPNRPIQSFDLVKDKGRPGDTIVVPWQGSALATLNALRAASAPSGGAAVAPSIACVKWWTVPAGPLTADLSGEVGAGYVGAAVPIAARLAGIYSTAITVDPASRAQAETWPVAVAPAGVHCGETSETVANLLDRLLLPLAIVWILDGAGRLIFRRLTWTGPVETLQADRIKREDVFKPLKTRRVGFQRNYRQHSDAEIATTILNATDVAYADGTPIETLKPAEAGANVTEARTAAAITGQGAFATESQAAYGSPLLIGFGALAPLASVSFGSPYLLEQPGGAQAILAAFKTALGQAASIFGQGQLATVSSVSFNSTRITRADGTTSVTESLVVTDLGTAAAIAGQGSLATREDVDYDFIKLDSLRKSDTDSDGGTYSANGLNEQVKVAGFDATITGVRTSGDLYISVSASVTYEGAPGPGYVPVNDSRVVARLVYPNGTTADFPLVSGANKLDLPSTQTGTHILRVYAIRGGSDQPPGEGGEPGRYSAIPIVSGVTGSLIWRAI